MLSTSEFKNSTIAHKSHGGTIAMIVLTIVTITASFVQLANIL